MSTARILFTAASVAVFAFGVGAWLGRWRGEQVKPAPTSTGLHVYLSHGGRLVYLCRSGKPISQVVNCDNGESVLLTAGLANELVLSTFRIEEGVKQ